MKKLIVIAVLFVGSFQLGFAATNSASYSSNYVCYNRSASASLMAERDYTIDRLRHEVDSLVALARIYPSTAGNNVASFQLVELQNSIKTVTDLMGNLQFTITQLNNVYADPDGVIRMHQ